MFSDHRALSQAFKTLDVHGRLARWLDLHAEYELKIHYKKGSQNAVADACSRISSKQKDIVLTAIVSGLEPELQWIGTYLETMGLAEHLPATKAQPN